ncbi:hypothetical protein L7F22_046031 [Adiantum nelumboides]|nr:hypothetical protein [Adiantum nelumboides]
MRRKLQLADNPNMEDSLHSMNCGEDGLSKVRMRRNRKQKIHKKGRKCKAEKDVVDCSSQSSHFNRGTQNSWGHSKSITENREQHQSLSEKHRPGTFEEMVGQSMISQALSNAIHRGKIAPAYLFQGPRGTGKTCAAKIFAASINCLFKDKSSKTSMPCRACRHCETTLSGKSSNLRIIDANNGIGDIKSLSRFITMRPHDSKHKVLIIDECQMLSKEAWSLFLNIIDQPPIHVVFILITTDTEQLPRMVISKCQKFSFIKIKDADILLRLWRLCEMEGIDAESNALQLIASRADGSLYDAETTLDQLTNLGQRITSGLVREMVGLVADEKLVELLDGAMKGDSVNTVRCIRQLMEAGIEPLALMSQLATLITDLLAGHPPPLSSSCSFSSFTSHPLDKMELEKLRQALKILSEAEKQLRSCNNKTTWLTAALLQFCPPDSALHLDSNNHEAVQSSSKGTSLTQSPNALLETSEKETADIPCYSTTNVKPPWDASHKWHDGLGEEEEERCHDTENADENIHINAVTRTNLQSKTDDPNPPADVVIPSYGTYHWSPSVHRKNARVESESCLQKHLIVAENTCVNYDNGNKDSSQVAPSSMDGIWKQVLRGSILTDILSRQGKLVSLSVSEAYAIAHLEFRLLEDKKRAENAKASISEAFQMALGCPVEVQFSLMSSSERANEDFNSSNNGFYGGTLQNTQTNHKKESKQRKRPSRARCCNQGSKSGNYYSKHRSWCNSLNNHQFLENSVLTSALDILRGSSSDESFTQWTQKYKLGPNPRTLRNTSTRFMRDKSYDHVDHSEKDTAFEKYTQCALSGSQDGKTYVSENVDDSSQDLFFDASLRVEKDSPNCSHQSFEYKLEYDRSNV